MVGEGLGENAFQRLRELLKAIRSRGYLIIIVLVVSISLLLMNYYTIKVLSGVRAYINGESFYSKGQEEASRDLIMYLDTENDKYWHEFRENLEINLGDGHARRMMLAGNVKEGKKGLLTGKNHSDDINNMIWLFTAFKDISLMSEPIAYWEIADSLVEELNLLGFEIRDKMMLNGIDNESKIGTKQKIYDLSTRLTVLGVQFSDSLGASGRQISHVLLIVNTIFIVLIIGGASSFLINVIRKLNQSEERLLKRNKDLKSTNDELDRFVYSASHDLRAPITSLKGLINIAQTEKDSTLQNQYFELMKQSLDKQDTFIKKIISFSKNKRTDKIVEEVQMEVLVDEILKQHAFMDNFSKLQIRKDIKVEKIYTDSVRLEIILSNIISNAIKYSDMGKEQPFIALDIALLQDQLNISIADNGIGISDSDKKHIFKMFFMTKNSHDGSGVGLYVVKETVEKLEGTVTVHSAQGIGTEFNIIIPVLTDVFTH